MATTMVGTTTGMVATTLIGMAGIMATAMDTVAITTDTTMATTTAIGTDITMVTTMDIMVMAHQRAITSMALATAQVAAPAMPAVVQ